MRKTLIPYFMWFLPLLFFSYQFILRMFPGLLMNEMINSFQITKSDFGLLSALYYLGYAGMQIPMSILLDKFGIKKVVFVSAISCSLATIAIPYSTHWELVLLYRFLIGAASAAGILGVSKAILVWFPNKLFSRMMGYTFTIGLLGAVYGGTPFQYIIDKIGWIKSLIYLGSAGIVIGLIVLFLFKEKTDIDLQKDNFSFNDLKKIILSKPMIMLAISNLLMVGTLEGFADVWGLNYFLENGISKSQGALYASFVFVGLIIGAPIISRFAEKYNVYSLIGFSGISMAIIMIMIIFEVKMLANEKIIIIALLTMAGVFCCYQIFVFDAGSKLVEPRFSSIAIAYLNCINMLGGSLFHTSIGHSIEKLSANYSIIHSYQIALSIIPIASLIGAAIALVARVKQNKGY